MIKLTTFEGLVVFEDHSISSADVLITSDMHLNHANILKYCPPRAEAYQFEFDKLVRETYGKPYCFQQQDDGK